MAGDPSSEVMEGLLTGDFTSNLFCVYTDTQGRFELTGLLDQTYEIIAMDPVTRVQSEALAVEAGCRDVTLTVDTTRVWSTLRGRVIDRRGVPFSGARVVPAVRAQLVQGPITYQQRVELLAAVTSGDDGFFELHSVPVDGRRAIVEHPEAASTGSVELSAEGVESELSEGEDVTVILSRRARFQIQLDDPDEADDFQLLDEAGEHIQRRKQVGRSVYVNSDQQLLTDGVSQHLFVGEGAHTLLLFKNGIEVRRVEVELESGEPIVLRP